jgi:hypothetical protein
MPATQADIDALTRAIATGQRQVTIGSQSITYRSISELLAARDALQTELNNAENEASDTKRPKQYRVYQSGRGYD